MDYYTLIDKFEKVYYEAFISEGMPEILFASLACGYNANERAALLEGVTATLNFLFGKDFDEIDRDIYLEMSLKGIDAFKD